MIKTLFIILFMIGQWVALSATTLTLNDLKSQEMKLLKIWRQQQPLISQVLLRLKNQPPALPPFNSLITKNLANFIHRNIVLKNLDDLLKKQQQQIVKLCQDIIQTRQDIKTLSLSFK